jgi:aerobic-type carbon monoxide dehydrogenase small subunit (CoxS/CutS family)
MAYTLQVNGRTHTIDADGSTPLLWVLRDHLRLTGTKFGCGIGVCGACTVHEDGSAVRSCTRTLAASEGKRYTTIEGLTSDGSHPCQRAWIEEDVAQCGYCQPGMIMEAAALLQTTPAPTDTDIDRVLATHVCRCGTYGRLRAAVHRAAGARA